MKYEQMQDKQLKLSILLAAIFLVSMFIVPFLNNSMTDAMIAPVLGIPFVWLFVGIVLHLEFWIMAIVYTTLSNRWEGEVTDE